MCLHMISVLLLYVDDLLIVGQSISIRRLWKITKELNGT